MADKSYLSHGTYTAEHSVSTSPSMAIPTNELEHSVAITIPASTGAKSQPEGSLPPAPPFPMPKKPLGVILPTGHKSFLRSTTRTGDGLSIREFYGASQRAAANDTFHGLRSPLPSSGQNNTGYYIPSIDNQIQDFEVLERTKTPAPLDRCDPFSSTNFPSVEYTEATPTSPCQTATTTEPFPDYMELMSPSDVAAPGTPLNYDPFAIYPIPPVCISSSKDTLYLDNNCSSMISTELVPELIPNGSTPSSSSNAVSEIEEIKSVRENSPVIFFEANKEVEEDAEIKIEDPFVEDILASMIVYQDDEKESDLYDISHGEGNDVESEISETDRDGERAYRENDEYRDTNTQITDNDVLEINAHQLSRSEESNASVEGHGFEEVGEDLTYAASVQDTASLLASFDQVSVQHSGFAYSHCAANVTSCPFHRGSSLDAFDLFPNDKQRVRWLRNQILAEGPCHAFEIMSCLDESNIRYRVKLQEELDRRVFRELAAERAKASDVIHREMKETKYRESRLRALHFEDLARWKREHIRMEAELENIEDGKKKAERATEDLQVELRLLQGEVEKLAALKVEVATKEEVRKLRNDLATAKRDRKNCFTIIQSLRAKIAAFEIEARRGSIEDNTTENHDSEKQTDSESTTTLRTSVTTTDRTGTESSEDHQSNLNNSATQVKVKSDEDQIQPSPTDTQIPTKFETKILLTVAQIIPRSATIPEIIITTPDKTVDRTSGAQHSGFSSAVSPIKTSSKEAEPSTRSGITTVPTTSTTSNAPAQAFTTRTKKWRGLRKGIQCIEKARKAIKQSIKRVTHINKTKFS